jgi:hypothetical protein
VPWKRGRTLSFPHSWLAFAETLPAIPWMATMLTFVLMLNHGQWSADVDMFIFGAL